MEKLYSETPLQRQRSRASSSGISDWLDYGQIATAGAPRDLTGEGVIALGALFSQMDFGLGKEDEASEVVDSTGTDFDAENFGKDFGQEYDLSIPNLTKGKATPKVGDNTTVIKPPMSPPALIEPFVPTKIAEEASIEQKTDFGTAKYGDDFVFGLNQVQKFMQSPDYAKATQKDKQDINRALQTIRGKGSDVNAPNIYLGNKMPDIFFDYMRMPRPERNGSNNTNTTTVMGGEKLSKKEFNSLSFNNKKAYIESQGGTWVDKYTNYDSLLKRLKPEILSLLEDLRYKNKGKDDTPLHRVIHAEQSPFLQTKGVDYRQMRRATAPSYTGEIGKAAMEGFNLVIDKYNYDQAVEADYEEELDDQMGSLNVEADFATDQARKDYLEVALAKKQKLAKGFNDYANGKMSKLEYENLKSTLQSEINMIAGTTTALTNLRKDYQENRGKINIKASDPEIADFLITLDKNPEAISFKTIDDIDYIKGKTRQGKDFQVPTSKIANGLAGFRLVENVSTTPMVTNALKEMNAYKETVKTDFGYGTAMASPEKAKEIGLGAIKSYLANDENALRSTLANKFGAGYTAYENLLGEDKAANRTAMLNDAAEYIYTTEVEERYFPRTITTKFKQDARTSSTAVERQRMQLSKAIGNLPAPTIENFNRYKSFIDTKYDYQIKDGKLLIGLKGKKKDEISLADPNFKSQFSRFTKLPSFIENPQDLSQYNFEL